MASVLFSVALFLICSMDFVVAQAPNSSAIDLGVVLGKGFLGTKYDAVKKQVEDLVKEINELVLDSANIKLTFFESKDLRLPLGPGTVLGLSYCEEAHPLAHRSYYRDKSFLGLTERGCKRIDHDSKLLIPLTTNSDGLVQFVKDVQVSRILTWQTVVVLHDDSVDKVIVGEILESLRAQATVMCLQITKGSAGSAIKKLTSKALGGKMLVVAREELIGQVSKEARAMGLFGYNLEWLFLATDTNGDDRFDKKDLMTVPDGANVAVMYNASRVPDGATCLDGVMCYVEELLRAYGDVLQDRMTEQLEIWKQVSDDEWNILKPSARDDARAMAEGVRKLISERGKCGKCAGWEALTVEVMEEGKINVLPVASWEPTLGLTVMDSLFPHVTGGFRGRTIKVTSTQNPPWTILKEDRGSVMGKGIMFSLLDVLAEALNFTYAVTTPQDGSIDGMLTQVANKEVMMAVSPILVTEERAEKVTFSEPVDMPAQNIMYRRPGELSKVTLFVRPFTANAWICIAVAAVVIGPLLWIVHNLSWYYKVSKEGPGGLGELKHCIWYCYGALLQQGGNMVPMADSGRVLIAFWWIFVIVIVTTYSGNLVAFLTIPQVEETIQDFNEMMRRGNHSGTTYGYKADSLLETYLKASDEPRFKEFYREAERNVELSKDVLDRIAEGEHTFVDWDSKLALVVKSEHKKTGKCDFDLAETRFFIELAAFAFPKDSPWIGRINKWMPRIMQARFLDRWRTLYWPADDACTNFKVTGASETVTVFDMAGSFFILGVGCAVGFIILFVECIVRKTAGEKEASVVKPFVA